MDRPYRPARDRDSSFRGRDSFRDRSTDNFRGRDADNFRGRDNFRDRDRDFNHQPRRPSRFSDGPPPPPPDRRSSPSEFRVARRGFHSPPPREFNPHPPHEFNHPPPREFNQLPPRESLPPSQLPPPGGPRPGAPGGFWPMGGLGPDAGGYGNDFREPPQHDLQPPQLSGQKRGFVNDFREPPQVPSPQPPYLLGQKRGFGDGFREAPPQQPPQLSEQKRGFGSDFREPPQQPPQIPEQERGFRNDFREPLPQQPPQLSGQKRGFSYPSSRRGESPEHYDGRSFVKVFVGSVPRTSTEEEIRPLFEEHGKVMEVALIKDKRTGQQQGCCFIKFATSEEADRAIRALHNQYTLPGGVGPIQVRYADGERERLGNVEYKLFVGSLNKFATEKEVEEIFAPYGRIEDVYLMRDERKQSRGCGFVKFYTKDSAMAAINALNGIYTMRGCDQPLTVRFADPKRPRAGDSRTGPTSGSPGFGSSSPGIRPSPGPNFPGPMGVQGPPNAWQPMSPHNTGPSPNSSIHEFGSQLPPRSGEAAVSSTPGGHLGRHGSLAKSSVAGALSAPSTSPQTFSPMFPQVPQGGQQISPSKKPLQTPQHPPSALQLHQGPGSWSQPPSQAAVRQYNQLQNGPQAPYNQPFSSQQHQGLPGQLLPQFQVQQSATPDTTEQRPNSTSSLTSSQLPAPLQQPLPYQQSPSQLAQMLSQQTQTLQASFQSSQQAFSQLQQQFHMMQPSVQNQPLQQSVQASKQQSQWAGPTPTIASSTTVVPAHDAQTSSSAPGGTLVVAKTAPLKCSWTEHTSPDGYKYYYNSSTGESKWDKPEELTLYEQQQQQKVVAQQPQMPSGLQAISTLPVTQSQPSHLQTQIPSSGQLQRPLISSMYQPPQGFGNQTTQGTTYSPLPAQANADSDPARYQQGFPANQDWAWKSNAGR